MSWGRPSPLGAGQPFARVFGHGAVRGQHAGSIKSAAPLYFWGQTNLPTARVLRPRCSRRRPLVGQGPDAPVAQPIVEKGEQFAGRGDLGVFLPRRASMRLHEFRCSSPSREKIQ